MDKTRYLDTAIDLNPQGRISEDLDLVGVREFFKGHLIQSSLDSLYDIFTQLFVSQHRPSSDNN